VSAPHRAVSLALHPVATHQAPRSPGPACQPRAPESPASCCPPLSRGNAATHAHRPEADAGRLSHFPLRPDPLSPSSCPYTCCPTPPLLRSRHPPLKGYRRLLFCHLHARPSLAPLRRAHELSPPPANYRRPFRAPRLLPPRQT
jgi:hypothetical protein